MLAAFLALLMPLGSLQAAVIPVDTTADSVGGSDCSLRNAVSAALFDLPRGGCPAGSGADSIDLSAIAGQTIVLANGPLELFDDQLNAARQTTLLGHGVTLDAQQSSRVMDIRFASVVIESLHLVNGDANAGGCLEIRSANVTIRNSSVSRCTADIGGGIRWVGTGDFNVSETTIGDNTATTGGGGIALIGGDGPSSAKVWFSGVHLSGNVATFGGGGARVEGNVEASFSNMTIENNRALFGAGLDIHEGYSVFRVSSSTLSNNSATNEGGGVATFFTVRLIVSDSSFIGNSSGGSGGGIYSRGSTDISGSNLTGNSAGQEGGALIIFGGASLVDSTLADNESAGRGGGIALYGGLSMTGSTLSGNHSDVQGGGIFHERGQVSIADSRITGNTAPGSGGGIFLKDGAHTITGSTLANNDSGGNGGAIFAQATSCNPCASLTLSDSTVSQNFAAARGGGIYAFRAAMVAVITNSTLSANNAPSGGAALVVDESTLTLRNSTVTDNQSSESSGGGSVWATDGGTFTSINSILFNPDDTRDCTSNAPGPVVIFRGVNIVGRLGCEGGQGVVGDGNLIREDPLLGPLADNGGRTLTHLPLAGSPAIDAGSDVHVPAGLNRDQRGSLYLRIDGAQVDLGAVEVTEPLPVTMFSDGLEDPGPL